jgi:hypothetical protein
MVRTLIINSSNYVVNSGNKYEYRFPQTAKFAAGSSVAVANLAIYNSIQNVTIKRGNNVITLNWLGTNYVFTIPEGYYSVSDLNFYLQQQCVINGLYMTANSGADNVYFLEIVINSIRYSTSLNFYAIPTEAEATQKGYVKPSNATWVFPASAQCPSLTFAQPFANLLGFTFGTFPPTLQSTNIQYLSTQTPVISPVDSLIFTCNLVSSKYSIPSDTFYSVPISASLGNLILFNNTSLVYNDIIPQNFSSLIITIYDQLFNPVVLLDKEMTMTLSISEPQ